MERATRKVLAIALGLLAVAAFAVAPAGSVTAQAGNDTTNETTEANQTTITVTATGQASGEPTTAVIRIESAAVAEQPADATDRVAENVSQLRDALLNATLTEEQIRTTDYRLEEVRPDDEPPRRGNVTQPVRFRAVQGLEIEIDNVSRAGEIVDVAVANGATSVRGVSFQLSEENQTELRQEAIESAMDDARTDAETLAAAESLSIDGVRSISTDLSFFGPEREVAVAQADGTTIDSGPITVRVTVSVTYEASQE